ncbi:hypothetical protein CJ177_35655 [Rhodococcus sp. ACPA1]|nr:hypothetical protein CJ177_35655 [Rhodococcus sp. ACPA1]
MENSTRDYPSARPSGPLNGKVAIVTGAPRSIRRAITQALTDDGASVVVHYRSRRAEAEETVAALRSRGAQALAVRADLTKNSEVSVLFTATTAHFGGVDIVVANAGVTAPLTSLAEVTNEQFDRLLAVNTRSVFLCSGRRREQSATAAGSSISPPARSSSRQPGSPHTQPLKPART